MSWKQNTGRSKYLGRYCESEISKTDMHFLEKERPCHEGGTSCFFTVVAMADVGGQWLPSHLIPDHAAGSRAMSDGRFRGGL